MAVTQLEIARRVGLDVSSVNKILNRRPGPVFKKDTIKQVFKVARELGYDFTRLKYHHKRAQAASPDGHPPGALDSTTPTARSSTRARPSSRTCR
jgi:transcriptional regulator with XRE-family HTH domain